MVARQEGLAHLVGPALLGDVDVAGAGARLVGLLDRPLQALDVLRLEVDVGEGDAAKALRGRQRHVAHQGDEGFYPELFAFRSIEIGESLNHAEALERIVKRHRFSPQDIEEVRAGTNRHAHDHIIGVIREPKDLTSAQFSANFSLALFLVKGGSGFHEYTDESLIDPGIIELSKKIRIYVDEEIEQEWQKTKPRGARVTVRLTSGETYTECVHMLRSMTAEDLNEKFRRLATVAVGTEQCERLVARVRSLEEVRDISSLVPLLT